jgi:hypothetical protein
MRQPDFASAQRRALAPAWQRLALAACALLALGSAVQAFAARGEARGAERRRADVRREVEAAGARLAAFEARARAAGGTLLAAEDAPPARIVAELAQALPEDVRFDRLAIDYRRGGALEMQVVARDSDAWDRMLRRMEAARHLRELEPGPEVRAGEIRSLVRARWAPGPP